MHKILYQQRDARPLIVGFALMAFFITACGSTSIDAAPVTGTATVSSGTVTPGLGSATATPLTPSSTTGVLMGTVMITGCPAVSVDTGCPSQPVPGQPVVVMSSAGQTVATATTDSHGSFAFALAPGDYRVVASSHAPGMAGKTQTQSITVVSGQTVTMTLTLDNGIR